MDNEQRAGGEGAELVQTLQRWRDAGAAWRVVGRQGRRVTVALLRCDAGEEVERLTSESPAWVAYLETHAGSE
jgi:hypothetical protein